MKKLSMLIISLTGTLLAQTASAHPGHDVASGALAGLTHPLTGIDHLLAQACVGVLFAMSGPRARWAGVVALMVALAMGAGLGLTGLVMPGAEWMIALSVLVAGITLVRSGVARPALLVGATAIFALFHGYAHGRESSGDALAFLAGFLAASFVVIMVFMVLARVLVRLQALRVAMGVGAGLTGVVLLGLLGT